MNGPQPALEHSPPALVRGIDGDQLELIREAVAGIQQACGFEGTAARTLAGEQDQLPMMQAAIAAVENVFQARGTRSRPPRPGRG